MAPQDHLLAPRVGGGVPYDPVGVEPDRGPLGPFAQLYDWPPFSVFRFPERYGALCALGAALLTAGGGGAGAGGGAAAASASRSA